MQQWTYCSKHEFITSCYFNYLIQLNMLDIDYISNNLVIFNSDFATMQLTFIGHSGPNPSAFYLYRATSASLSSTPWMNIFQRSFIPDKYKCIMENLLFLWK